MNVGTLEIQLLANMARLQSDMERAQRTVGGAVSKINSLLGAIGVGISVDFLLGLATKANEYSKSLAALSTQISGATGQIKELDAASRSLSVQFGTTAIKQSAGFYEILSAGITDTAQATALLTEANRLAIGGNADLMISVDGLTSIIKGYGSAAGTAAEIADTMFTASLAGKLSIQELSEGIGKVIPLATTMGVSLEEITAAISALTLGGISAKESITGVRAILAAVAKPSSEAARLAKEIGLEFNSASIQANGFAKFLEDVKTKTQGSSDQMAILFGGVESLVPALALTTNAGVEFNSILGQMANKAGATEEAFNKMAASPGFKWDQFMSTMSNIAITLGDVLANVLTPAAEMAAKALNKLFGFNDIKGIEKQVQLVNQLTDKVQSMANRTHVPLIGGLLFDKKEFDLLEHQLEMAKVDLASMNKAQEIAQGTQKKSTAELIKNTVELEKNNAVVTKSARIAEVKNKAFDTELYLLKQYDDEARRSREITQSVATEQEIYNQKLEELNRLKPYLTIETYDRALAKLSDTNKKVEVSTRNTTDEVSQLWMQAGRNIQSTFANSIFNIFDDGLDGMVKNAGIAAGRILSEFAALKLAQNIGLSSMFTAGGIGGTGSKGVGLGSMFDLASMGSNAMSMFRGGMSGITGLVGRGVAMLPGSLGAFGTGMLGSAGAGAFSAAGGAGTAFIGGAGTALGGTGMGVAAGLGASLSAVAGPLAALAAGFMGGKMIAGQNKIAGIGGTEAALIGTALGGPVGAVVAGAILKLFGRGPFKFRQQSLQGTIYNDGFDGDITNVERAKGGVFRSNAHRSTSLALTSEMQDLFDTAIGAYYKSAHGFAESLGLDVNLVDGFTKEFQIKSEKGKQLTGEAVTALIASFGDSIAQNLIPTIETLKKGEETAFQTLTRLGGEFDALASGAVNLGASVKFANELIKGMSFDSRSALLELAGGAENLSNLTGFFAQNFLTEAERLSPIQEQLVKGLGDLGFASDLTNQQYKELVQSLNIPDETRIKLLELAPALLTVNAALDATNQAAAVAAQGLIDSAKAIDDAAKTQANTNLGNLFAALQRSVEAERKKVTDAYNNDLLIVNKSIQNVTDSISKLKSLSSALGSTIDALRPLSRGEAKFQLLSAINKAKSGSGLPEAADISKALDVLKSNNITGVRSSFEMAREQAKTANLVADLSSLTDSQLSVEERSLIQLQDQKRTLDDGFRNEMERLDGILEQAQAQIDAMNGLNTSVVSLTEAIKNFNLASTQGGGGTIGGGEIASGNPNISNQEIIDFFKTEHSARQIYLSAVGNGVSSAQIVNSGAVTQAEADKFFRDNPKIPRFAAGGYHRGGLRIVGEDGPELERTGPSNITSNSDMKKATGIDEVIIELREVKKILAAVTQGGTAIRTKTA